MVVVGLRARSLAVARTPCLRMKPIRFQEKQCYLWDKTTSSQSEFPCEQQVAIAAAAT